MAQPRKSNLPQLSPTQRGILALLRRDYPSAAQAFTLLYHHPSWQVRDTAVIGLGDLLDLRVIEAGKQPAVIPVAGWQPPHIALPRKTTVTDERLLVLLETFYHPTLRQPHNLNEYKILQALLHTKTLLENALLYDPHELVRTSSLIVLYEYFQGERHTAIRPALERAYRREKQPDIKAALKFLLAR